MMKPPFLKLSESSCSLFTMFDLLITSLIPLILFLFLVLPYKKDKLTNKEQFFSKNYTTALKGMAAIVVIFVHLPEEYGNPLQDAIGSFAYIAVTYFFLVSAYGMQLAAETKTDYMNSFWKNRLASLLIPMIIVNVLCFAAEYLLSGTLELWMLTKLNGYVAVLLTYCLWFWLLETIGRHFGLKRKTIDIINIIGVAISSLILYLSDIHTGWCFERIGLIWGLLLFRYFPAFINWLRKSEKSKQFVFLIIALFLGVVYLKYKSLYFWGGYTLKIMLGIALLICLALWSSRIRLNNKVLLFLGSISYEIYLIHGFFIILLHNYIKLKISSGVFIVITIVSTIMIAYLVNLVAHHLVKRDRKSVV